MSPWLALSIACAPQTSSTPADPAPVAPEPVAPEPADLPDLPAELLAAGLCADEGQVRHVDSTTLADGRTVHAAQCVLGAYQGAYQYSFDEPKAPIRTTAGEVLTAVGLPELGSDGSLSYFSKGRGLGDCGNTYRYQLHGDAFRLVEERGRECTVEGGEGLPDTFPVVPRGHCTVDEIAWFACDVAGGKAVSVCGRIDTVQYRYGPSKAPEIVHPEDGSPAGFRITELTGPVHYGYELRVDNEAVTYVVYDTYRSDVPGETKRGVRVEELGRTLADIPCTGAAGSRWRTLLEQFRSAR